MKVMQKIDKQTRTNVEHRLRRIEGQVRGVQRMLTSERECDEMLQQLAAIRSAVQQTALLLARSYTEQCVTDPEATASPQQLSQQLLQVWARVD